MKLYLPCRLNKWESLKLEDPDFLRVSLKAPAGSLGFIPVYESPAALAADWGVGMKYLEMETKEAPTPAAPAKGEPK